MKQDTIDIKNARTHNLKNITVSIPKNKITTIIGPSGAGKTSLAYDTLFAEGSRKYIQSLSSNQQFFMDGIDAPDVDVITGLTPTVAIQNRVGAVHTKSTMGTLCDLDRYLRILYTALGTVYCPDCNKELRSDTISDVVDFTAGLGDNEKVEILAPLHFSTEEIVQVKQKLQQNGFVRIRIHNEIIDISEWDENQEITTCEVVVDRLKVKPGSARRITDSVETAYVLSEGAVVIKNDDKEYIFSEHNRCHEHGFSVPALHPKFFSLHNPTAVCAHCCGEGIMMIDSESKAGELDSEIEQYIECPECKGSKYSAVSLAVLLGKKNIAQVQMMNLPELKQYIDSLDVSTQNRHLYREIFQAITSKIKLLTDIGLAYLQCGRQGQTLSEGELQRVNIVGQLGVGLSGLTYIIDEPTAALHPLDARHVIKAIRALKDAGNTVVVVDHNVEMMQAADYIVDLGPKGGREGGNLICSGLSEDVLKHPDSLTAQYVEGTYLPVGLPVQKNRSDILFKEISGHNLQNLNITLKHNALNVMCGVSGSGKSSFGVQTVYPYLKNSFSKKKIPVLPVKEVTGLETIDRVVMVTRSASGVSARANLATYTKLFDTVRNLFSKTPEAKIRGYSASRFSYNVKGGRCERCKGEGLEKTDLPFMLSNGAECSACGGKRYGRDVLELLYKGKNIADILDMSVQEASRFYRDIPKIFNPLNTLIDLGLGYLTLGQPLNTYSTGELRRLKLGADIASQFSNNTLYILDEPSRSLHFTEVLQLITVLGTLIKQGHTLLVIDHHPLLVQHAQWVVELGPGGGVDGGALLYQGDIQGMHDSENSQMKEFV